MSFSLTRHFPELAVAPRVALGSFPTPVQTVDHVPGLWVKRDDRSGEPFGGNKIRALEFLLATAPPASRLVTVGGAGSTHALTTVLVGQRTGHAVFVGRWRQEMNKVASVVADRIERHADTAPLFSHPAVAYLWAIAQRLGGASWIPGGGTSPLGMLGHVNAGLELADQITSGDLDRPAAIVVPLGSGGTAAGIALGLHMVTMNVPVIAVRVVPRIVANAVRLRSLMRRTARLIAALGGPPANPPPAPAITLVHDAYGGAYGRETDAGRRASCQFRQSMGFSLDATYSAKAFAVAIERARREPTLFWLTFDPRMLSL